MGEILVILILLTAGCGIAANLTISFASASQDGGEAGYERALQGDR